MRIPWFTRTPTPTPAPWRGPAQDTRDANAASIAAIPLSVLPDGPARRLLIAEAATGRDVYAFHSGLPEPRGVWNIWYGKLADVSPGRDGRVPARVWAAQWDVILLAIAGGSVPQEITQANGGAR